MACAHITYEALSHQTGGFRAIIENLPMGVMVADQNGTILLFNPAAQQMFGASAAASEIPQWPLACGVHLPDKTTCYPAERLPLVRALRGEEITDELMFVRNEHNPLGSWIRASARPLRDAAGAQHGAVVVYHDVSERRNAVERIQLLSRAVEQTADSVLITDRAGIIQYVNPAFEVTTGYGREQAIGQSPRILKSGQHAESFYRELWDCITRGDTFRGTLINRRKTGELYWAEQTITPIKNDAGVVTHFVSVLKDVTELKKQQEQEIQLKLAREVQQRFYASKISVPGTDIGVAARMADETGGDYCDLICLTDTSACVAIGDVSGHGFGSALLMALTRAYVRAFCGQGLGVSKILMETNRMLVPDLEANRFVTLLLAHVDLAAEVLAYANAGHVPGFILNASGDVQYMLESTGTPLGLFSTYRVGTRLIPLKPGQVLVLLTDGVTEEAGNADHRLGAKRIIKYVRRHRTASAQAIAEGVCETARAYSEEGTEKDDASAVVLKIGTLG